MNAEYDWQESLNEEAANRQIEYDQLTQSQLKENHVHSNTDPRQQRLREINESTKPRSVENSLDSVHQKATSFPL